MRDVVLLTDVKGVGEALAKKLAVLGLTTTADLIDYYPRRYEDYSVVTPISELAPGAVTIQAVIKEAKGRYVRRGMHITEAVASDDSDSTRIVWFNQPYRAAALKKNQPYFISGVYELSHQRFAIMNPSAELVSDFPVNTARIVPVYRETKGLSSHQIRKILKQLLPQIRSLPETLPEWLITSEKLLSRAEAVEAMHFPASSEQLKDAKRRLGFEEVFGLSLASLLNKQEIAGEKSITITFNEKLAQDFVANLPFKLTDAQRKVAWQIFLDMQTTQPMNRLVEGDVGSGKTVVAAMAALMVVTGGHQVAFMAPTELLARQHAHTIYNLFKPLGRHDEVSLLVGGMTAAQKAKAHRAIEDGRARFIIGTHALIQEKVDMRQLGLVIVDEQHRFGVEQRQKLQAKAGHAVHTLNLTATPIPRSLALTLYGELDVSILDQKPVGRQPIITKICSPNSRQQLYADIKSELDSGRQMFVVCPLIAESSVLDASSAEKIYEVFSKKDFKEYRVGLLHGKMKAEAKNEMMRQFVDRKLDILVSTTVIEVGVDVPNATVMLIEAAERFGLAQIHQLRGRVGRSDAQGYCYLMMSDSSAPSRRLRALESSNDGFRLAELDLEIRGPGAIYGQMQHGQLDLRVANLSDTKLISSARAAAQQLIDQKENLIKYPDLAKRVQGLRAVTNLN